MNKKKLYVVVHSLPECSFGGVETFVNEVFIKRAHIFDKFDIKILTLCNASKENVISFQSNKKYFLFRCFELSSKSLEFILNDTFKEEEFFVIFNGVSSGYKLLIKLLKFRPKAHLIGVIHGFGYESAFYSKKFVRGIILFLLEMFLYKKLKYAICVSDRSYYKIKKLNSKIKCRVIYNGAYIYNINPILKDKHSLCFVWRMTKQKGVDLLIKAINLLEKDINFKFFFVGDGPLKKDVLKLVDKDPRVYYAGTKENTKEKLLTKCGIFVLPSRFEGLPISLMEALGHKCVVITTDFLNQESILKNYCIFFKSGSALDLRNKIVTVLRDIDKLLIKSSKFNYTWDACAKRYKEFLDNIK